MAHEIARIAGMDSFAYAGEPGWHGLGQVILPTDSPEEQLRKAGLLYRIEKAPLYYRPACDRPVAGQPSPAARVIGGKVTQYRDDTGGDLGIVGDTFQTVQPREARDFFDVWCREGGATIETLGALHGGRVYFGLARIGEAVQIGEGDPILPYIYWSTACDGTRKTKVKNTAIRVVCANTDAMTAGNTAQFEQSHRSVYDPGKARDHVEKALVQFGAYCAMARGLAAIRLDSVKASELTETLLGAAKTEKGRTNAAFARVMALFQGAGAGATLATAKGTAWGWLQACTDYVDHDMRATSADNRLDSAQDGNGAKLKSEARDLVLSI